MTKFSAPFSVLGVMHSLFLWHSIPYCRTARNSTRCDLSILRLETGVSRTLLFKSWADGACSTACEMAVEDRAKTGGHLSLSCRTSIVPIAVEANIRKWRSGRDTYGCHLLQCPICRLWNQSPGGWSNFPKCVWEWGNNGNWAIWLLWQITRLSSVSELWSLFQNTKYFDFIISLVNTFFNIKHWQAVAASYM